MKDSMNVNTILLTMTLGLLSFFGSRLISKVDNLTTNQATEDTRVALIEATLKQVVFKEDMPALLNTLRGNVKTDRRDDSAVREQQRGAERLHEQN